MRYSKYNFWILWLMLMALVFFNSCTPQQRLSNLLARHPELIKTDTVFRSDTIWTSAAQTDTIFRTQITKDTVIIRENNLTVKYFNDGKTTYLKGTCDTIRIIREITTQITQVEAKPLTWWERAWGKIKDFITVLLLGAVIVMLYITRKRLPL